ncbi:MAG: hypothetical protein ACM34G_17265 [Acidobacteriota bacterium]
MKSYPYGVCRRCWEENAHRQRATRLGVRAHMLCPMCRRRLVPFHKAIPMHKIRLVLRHADDLAERLEQL